MVFLQFFENLIIFFYICRTINEDFEPFVFTAIERDVCKAFTDFSQYTTTKAKELLPYCKTIS